MQRQILYAFVLIIFLSGCQKFLDKKPDKSRFIVSRVSELQGLFDYENTYTQYPASGLLASDDGYYTTENYNTIFFQVDRDTYTWNPTTDLSQDWALCYEKIFKMNVILEEIENISETGAERDLLSIKGSALFVRALTHFQVAQLFAPYNPFNGPDNDLGIPLKLTANIESATTRASLKQSYQTIIDDLESCILMLPDTGLVKTRPGKSAAYSLLAKIYLDQGNYERSEKYADSSLAISKDLMDYNDKSQVDINSPIPFKILNREVIYHTSSTYGSNMSECYADSTLVSLFDTNDLRRSAFFERPTPAAYRFKGSYTGTDISVSFTGLSTNEVLLIRSESKARNGNINGALQDLNRLLVNRCKTGAFLPLTAANQEEAIRLILIERRKELCFRPGTRWSDLRRLNRDPRYAITLRRFINGVRYELPPGDNRYTFLIPASVIVKNNLSQNPR